MNNIAFRAWHKEQKWMGEVIGGIYYSFDEIILMPAVDNLKDLNGIQVFEGDIVYFTFHIGESGIVKYEDFRWTIDFGSPERHPLYRFVIRENVLNGNIIGNEHQNPELLKEVKT